MPCYVTGIEDCEDPGISGIEDFEDSGVAGHFI
jgi:hypothetical protein